MVDHPVYCLEASVQKLGREAFGIHIFSHGSRTASLLVVAFLLSYALHTTARAQDNSATSLFEKGHELIKERDCNTAAKLFAMGLAKDPNNAQAHYDLARCLKESKQSFPDAIEHFREAATLSPNSKLGLDALSEALRLEAAVETQRQRDANEKAERDAEARKVAAARQSQISPYNNLVGTYFTGKHSFQDHVQRNFCAHIRQIIPREKLDDPRFDILTADLTWWGRIGTVEYQYSFTVNLFQIDYRVHEGGYHVWEGNLTDAQQSELSFEYDSRTKRLADARTFPRSASHCTSGCLSLWIKPGPDDIASIKFTGGTAKRFDGVCGPSPY